MLVKTKICRFLVSTSTAIITSIALVSTTPFLVSGQAEANTRGEARFAEIKEALADLPSTLTGTYLSANLAENEQDLTLAAHFYAEALQEEPDDPFLLERNFVLMLASGEYDAAFKLADQISKLSLQHEAQAIDADVSGNKEDAAPGQRTDAFDRVDPMVHLALGVKALKGKSYAQASKAFEEGIEALSGAPIDFVGTMSQRMSLDSPQILSASAQHGPFALIAQTVLHAWALIGQDRKNLDAALKSLEVIDDSDANQFFYSLHAGLIAAYAKDYERAIDYLQSSFMSNTNSATTAEVLIYCLIKADKKTMAKNVLNGFLNGNADEGQKAWIKRVFNEMQTSKGGLRTPQQGAAELFTTLGDALTQEKAIMGGALYLQFANYLDEHNDRTEFSLAQLYELMDHDETALTYFNAVDPSSAIYRTAQRMSGLTLARLERTNEAISRLKRLVSLDGSDLETIVALSRVYQSDHQYKKAIHILTQGIDSIEHKSDIHWSLYFMRGTAYDHIKDWKHTEQDLQAALKLFPDQPTVLNYLGYSWVDRGLNLKQAMGMIRKAVTLRPYDGFFIDSLGWAHYKLEQYEQAVLALERAVELRPEDPTITDHLGDAYWKAGRKNEAYFQWERVKTLDPSEDLLSSVNEKIKDGLKDEELPNLTKK